MQNVLNYLKQNQARFVAELCEFLRFPSVSAQTQHKDDCRACAEWVAQHCSQIGLTRKVCPTAGHPIVLAKTPSRPGGTQTENAALHFLVYGHYDVQPPEPLELWHSPPFEAAHRESPRSSRAAPRTIKARFSRTSKPPKRYLKTGTPLACDLTLVIEGEEEVGGKNLTEFLKTRRKELHCEAVIVSDTGMPDKEHPALGYGLRGIVAFEIVLKGPSRDLHSGIFGGAIENPAMALSVLLSKMRDKNGRIEGAALLRSIAASLSAYERKQFKRLPYRDSELVKLLGVKKLFGERGFTATEQRTARPTIEINGLTSGYQGEGSKTIIPAWARAKITCRLVPNQKPAKIHKIVCDYLKKDLPADGAAGN